MSFMYIIIPSADKDTLTSSFPVQIPFELLQLSCCSSYELSLSLTLNRYGDMDSLVFSLILVERLGVFALFRLMLPKGLL